MLKLLSPLLFLLIAFSQNIKISITNKQNKEPIEGAEVFYGSKLYTTNETGLVLIRRQENIKKIEIKHVSYKSLVFFLNETNSYEIELEEAIYTNEIVVSAYRKKPVIINETEVKQKPVNVSRELIKLTTDINSLVSTIDNVHIDKGIDGSSNINILASNSDEVNFKINKLNLFLLSNSESYLNSLIPLSLKSIDLDMGNKDHFIGTINAQFDYSAKNVVMSTMGNEFNDFKVSYNTNSDDLITLNSFSYTGSNREYEVEDINERIYTYPIADEFYRINSLQNLFLENLEIENVLIVDINPRYYLTTIDKQTTFIADGLNLKINDQLSVFNNFNSYRSTYNNYSSNTIFLNREDHIFEHQIGAEYTEKYETSSITTNLTFSTYSNSIVGKGLLLADSEASDFKKNVNLIYKYLPERSPEESRVIFEVNLNLGHYQSDFYMENLGLKSSIDVQQNPFVWEFYTDLTFSKRPFLSSQRIISSLTDSVKFLRTDNLLFGTKINYRQFSFDLNYSNRNYSEFLNKEFDLIFFNYTFNHNVIMRVYNANFSQQFGDYVNLNFSGQYFFSDNELSIFNRPKLLVTNNLQLHYLAHEMLISVKYMKDRHIVTSYNNIPFKRILDEVLLVNLNYKISDIFESKFSASIEINNLLNASNYTINGLNLKQKDVYITLAYEF